ncbi:hypothetical protein CUT44_02735 [Streptomyces carminius]|uniref:Uncharacterized protein n=2 Tax=Streptomyces carminius TaxID=2665496 RepID=A0A2M8MBP8_9ACTN|nr:hypothetical protein CUT44_02735 [Streptomyces carminius]
MTLRVSRDGGRTWGPVTVVRSGGGVPALDTMAYPPCACPRCAPDRARDRRVTAALRRVNRRFHR